MDFYPVPASIRSGWMTYRCQRLSGPELAVHVPGERDSPEVQDLLVAGICNVGGRVPPVPGSPDPDERETSPGRDPRNRTGATSCVPPPPGSRILVRTASLPRSTRWVSAGHPAQGLRSEAEPGVAVFGCDHRFLNVCFTFFGSMRSRKSDSKYPSVIPAMKSVTNWAGVAEAM